MAVLLPENAINPDEIDLFGCGPWGPLPPQPDISSPTFIKETSGEYVARLEAKLTRLRSCRSDLTSHDLMDAIKKLRASQMEQFMANSSSEQSVAMATTPDDDDGDSSDEVHNSTFNKRFRPEKVALTAEEKYALVNYDILSKIAQSDEKALKQLPLLMGWFPSDWDQEDSAVNTDEEDSISELNTGKKRESDSESSERRTIGSVIGTGGSDKKPLTSMTSFDT